MATDMTKGPVVRPLVRFTLPLVLANVFQLTYNAADAIIVGRFVGKEALAAVGAAGPVVNIITFLVVGACLGAGVLMSEFFGAQDRETLRCEIGTSLTAGLAFTIALVLGCGLLAHPLLSLTRVPEDLLPSAALYLQIVCAALPFTFLYNLFASALRAVGDSRTPLFFVAASACANIIVDYVFVVVLDWGVQGAALATALAMTFSGVLCTGYVWFRIPLLRPGWSQLRPRSDLLHRTIGYSWVTAMQQAALYIGKLLVQSCVNTLGVDTIAAFNAVNRVDDFAYTPQQNIAHAMTTFLAQNRGAGKKDRMEQGFRAGALLEVVYWAALAVVVLLSARGIMSLFVDGDETVVDMGTSYLHWMALLYLMPACTNWIQGYFRGLGDLKVTLISTSVQMLGRVSFTFILAPHFGIEGIAFAQMGGWIVMLAYEVPVLLRTRRKMKA
ncbi:MATE family efflux transporter [uncultured Ruthenibacterium sp.]|uniref:MATE family efflux transporter n=1 Tax=uncultured Ruthenibacterium sp. TaxID=1905347 RepID=UPI00349EC1C9